MLLDFYFSCVERYNFSINFYLFNNKYRNLRTQQMLVHSLVCIFPRHVSAPVGGHCAPTFVAYGGFYTYWLIKFIGFWSELLHVWGRNEVTIGLYISAFYTLIWM
jgi:hypothetical protein